MPKNKVIVCGSIAYDVLYTYPRDFSESLILDGKTSLAVSFVVGDKKIFFGGCAGNIGFAMRRCGGNPLVLGMAGKDFAEYSLWLEKQKIATDAILVEAAEFTSQASVITDVRGQQLTFFHEGAPGRASRREAEIKAIIKKHAPETSLMHIAPTSPPFIHACIAAAIEANLPFIFDPGQVLPLFSPRDLNEIVPRACGLALNEYELHMLCRMLKKTTEEVIESTPLLLLTMAEKGSRIYFKGDEMIIKASAPKRVADPTGCGDAYRGAFLTELAERMPKLTREAVLRAGQLGSELAAQCLSRPGTQTY